MKRLPALPPESVDKAFALLTGEVDDSIIHRKAASESVM